MQYQLKQGEFVYLDNNGKLNNNNNGIPIGTINYLLDGDKISIVNSLGDTTFIFDLSMKSNPIKINCLYHEIEGKKINFGSSYKRRIRIKKKGE